ncbi:hypothetical protein H5V45_13130 [Nocardioides sp. KIGAM211]|uniref:Uncharacterized protein n=1 Tax=Nocardioides luti TaxID=2761101 RepID=A0A7X0RJ69_9ACTN|nr:hypothetical protein [Nocardioides luti]MBB6628265.1 hypothetical protein [Nocardioides luti]
MRLTHRAAVLALVGSLVLAGCGSGDEPDAAATGPVSSAASADPSSARPSASSEGVSMNEAIPVVTLLSKNLEAYKTANGKYPKPGSPEYQQVVGIDQADGFTIQYGVDGAGAMTICASADGDSAGYASRTGEVTPGTRNGCR